MSFTLADLATVPGATAAATLALVLVQVLKAGLPGLFEKVTGATFAFAFTGVLYGVAAIVALISGVATTPEGVVNQVLAILASWVGCATIALGLKNVASGGASTFVRGAPVDPPPPPVIPPA